MARKEHPQGKGAEKKTAKKVAAKTAIAKPAPKIINIARLKRIYMSPKEWIKVERNPIQKENRASRRKNAHLRIFNETHAQVHMAVYPDGHRRKIDGHGRAHIWENGLCDVIPRRIEVILHSVKNDAEAAQLFRYYDSPEAKKNASDNVHGAFRYHDVPTNSTMFQSSSGIATPLGYAFEIFNAATSSLKNVATSKANVYDHVGAFKDQLTALDGLASRCGSIKSPIIGAFMLAHMKYGEQIVPFFERVLNKNGVKIGKKMDPVYAVEKLIAERQGKAREEHLECVSQILGALATYMEGQFTNPDYVPKVNMQRSSSVDLRQYLLVEKARRTGAGRVKNRFTR